MVTIGSYLAKSFCKIMEMGEIELSVVCVVVVGTLSTYQDMLNEFYSNLNRDVYCTLTSS